MRKVRTASGISSARRAKRCLTLVFTGGISVVLALLAATSLPTRGADSTQSVEQIPFLRDVFLHHAYSARWFGPARWQNGGESYTTLEPSSADPHLLDIVRYETATGKREVLVSGSELIPSGADQPIEIEDYDWSPDANFLLIFTNSRRVWRLNTRGDYWLFDRRAKTLTRIGGDAPPATLMFATFSPDGSKVAYVHDNNLYVEDLQTHAVMQLTNDGSESIINGTSDWVYEEELDVRKAFQWSPDSRRIAYWRFDTSPVKHFALIYDVGAPYEVVTHIPYPEFGVYPLVKQVPYPEPGTPNSMVKIGVVPATGGTTVWMNVVGDPEKSYIARMDWAGNSDSLVIQHLNRRQDRDDVVLANADSGTTTVVYSEHDEAWVDVVDDFRWLDAGKQFLWVSEKDGWRHAYAISREGTGMRLLTPGSFDVVDVLGVDPAEQWIYYIASPENATQRYLYRSRLKSGGAPERLTPAGEPGTHSYDIAPDFRWAFHTYSTIDSPPTVDLVDLAGQHVRRVLQDNAPLKEKLRDLIAQPTEYLRLDIGEGVVLDGWMIKPKNFDPAKKYPALVYVYGEPAGQTVADRWDGEQGLWHRFIANQGYIVLSFDNRGTPAPRGREWRKIVYGSVGVLSSKEQAAALRKLAQIEPFVDPSRVAVWGWSGGGTNTLNLMFRHPELYSVGMSVAPVPDQRLYDSIYQERYMGLPETNAEGYKASSAINYAEGLRGKLLIVHSEGDDNVHYQGTELLINRLVELGKQFDFMEYPGRTHSLSEGVGTHYHLYCLLTRYLEDHLAPGPEK